MLNVHLGSRRKRQTIGKITMPSTHMDQLKAPKAQPQQGEGFTAPKPVSPASQIRTYKRRGIGGRKSGGR